MDKTDVGVDSRLVILIHASFVFIQATEILLHVHQLVLQDLIVTLSLPKISCFFHKLGDHTLLLRGLAGTVALIAHGGVADNSLLLLFDLLLM